MLNRKPSIILWTVGLIKKTWHKRIISRTKILGSKCESEIKADLKNATSVDTSDFSKKTDLDNSKCDVNNLDIDKNVPRMHQVD